MSQQGNTAPKLRYRTSIFGFVLFLVMGFDVCPCQSSVDKGVLATEGDIILGGLFPLHRKSKSTENACGVFSEIPGYHYMEAMLFAIDQINQDPNLLPKIKIGTQIYDTCQSKTIAADRAKEFIKMTLNGGPSRGQLAGVVGAYTSGVTATVANFLRVFEIPQISYASTSVLLSNKDIYSYLLRTVAPDSFQAQAMVDIIRKFGWTYVSTVNSAGDYGTRGIEIFWKFAQENDICIDTKERLDRFPTQSDYEEVIRRLVTRSEKSNVSVVVIFGTSTDARHLLEAAKVTQGAERFTWIGSDDATNQFQGTVGEAAVGSLGITFRRGEVVEEFKDYFMSLNWTTYSRRNRCFQEFWESRFKCHPLNGSSPRKYNVSCRGDESLGDVQVELSPVRVVINAVYAFAHALDSLQKELCPNVEGMCAAMIPFQRSRLLEHLKNVSFQDPSLNTTVYFDQYGEVHAMYDIVNLQERNGSLQPVRVATWDGEVKNDVIEKQFVVEEEEIKWRRGSSTVPQSYCTRECKLGAVRVPRWTFDFKCCWDCKSCDKLQIVMNNTCQYGPEGWVPNRNRTGWLKRKLLYPEWNDSSSIALIVIALVSMAMLLFTVVIYIANKENRLVKASGRELCYVMLVGIFMCFLIPFLFIAKPNDPLCYTRNLVTALALALCYAPLFMKINRIYRIFTSAKSSVARPPMVTPRVQLLVTFGLVSIQLMFTTLWFIAKPVEAIEKYYSDKEELVLECKADKLSFSVNLCYVIVLMVLCTAYAFKTRNFPKNFNESKYIGITMYITCSIWVIFFPFYLNTDYSFTHSYFISGACVTVGLVTLIGLFAQKIYIILFVDEIRNDDLVLTSRSLRRRSEEQRNRKMSEMEADER